MNWRYYTCYNIVSCALFHRLILSPYYFIIVQLFSSIKSTVGLSDCGAANWQPCWFILVAFFILALSGVSFYIKAFWKLVNDVSLAEDVMVVKCGTPQFGCQLIHKYKITTKFKSSFCVSRCCVSVSQSVNIRHIMCISGAGRSVHCLTLNTQTHRELQLFLLV